MPPTSGHFYFAVSTTLKKKLRDWFEDQGINCPLPHERYHKLLKVDELKDVQQIPQNLLICDDVKANHI